MIYIKSFLLVILGSLFIGCGGGGTNSSNSSLDIDSKYSIEYKGLKFYYKNLPTSEYKLTPLTDSEFNNLSSKNKLLVANKLLSTLFFGYPQQVLNSKIDSGSFISDIQNELKENTIDKEQVESDILDSSKFQQSTWNEQEAVNILSRLYVMDKLDKYFLHNWIAYILTQTIMFSPAYELDSTHRPNITTVYNRIVNLLEEEGGMRYITYVHMSSEDNWRRFRSPEDNGREMLEIFLLDQNDTHVPIAGKALQNWKLDRDSDTLVVGLNQNRKPLKLFGTTIYNGDDFYRELVKSKLFINGVTSRLVDFFFPNFSTKEKNSVKNNIISSNPETWQDILLQIVFSKKYLLNNYRAKSAEETFFSLAKKIDFQHRVGTFHELKNSLEDMHQATMKYKLGKIQRVPLDTLSFINYYKYIREKVLLRESNPDKIDDYEAWDRQGWSINFIKNDGIDYDNKTNKESLIAFINYIFKTTIYREATKEEMQMFLNLMLKGDSGREEFTCCFNMFEEDDDPQKEIKKRLDSKSRITKLVLEYIARLDDTFVQKEVK
ncbi:MAG: hypothetical protein GXO60_00970 [Epsilonproteobacteria bacterium]|nr:hypothetical protein [Campylobacterota bacterium]